MKEVDHELVRLCGKLRDEEITDEEIAALEKRLQQSPSERAYYLRFMQIDALLEKFPPIVEETVAEESIAGGRLIHLPVARAAGWLAAAALITLVCTVGVQALFPSRGGEEVPRVAKRSIATLVFAEDCSWKKQPFTEGQRLTKGLLQLTSGTAVVRFDGGAEAVLTGPMGLQLDSSTAAMLIHGEVVVRAEEGAEGFILDTPSGRLIDLGTEFAVKVEDSGATELHVHEGEVALGADFREKPGNVIEAGKAVRLAGNLSAGRSDVALDAPRFQELLEWANPRERRDLMTAYEGFHVDPGIYLPREITGGKGWKDPWRHRTEGERQDKLADVTDRLTIAMSKMEVAWPIKGGQLGMLELPQGPNIWIREMQKPLKMDKWGIRYFSFLVTEPEEVKSSKKTGKPDRQDLRFTFRSLDDYFGETLSIGWERSLRPRVSSDSGLNRSIRAIPGGQTVFCVAKIETRKGGSDRVSFRFYTRDEPLDIVEPAEWDVTLTDLRQDANYDLLVLTSNSQKVRYLDEIRMGPSWRSVTPIDSSVLLMSSVKTQ